MKALVVIDIQNDITKHYRDVIGGINAAVAWALSQGMPVVYIKHNNPSPGTRTFKPGTRGEELAPELDVVSDNIFVKTKSNALTSEAFSAWIGENGYEPAGPMFNIYHVSPHETRNPDEFVTEICYPVKKMEGTT